jgi:hypothetical protein
VLDRRVVGNGTVVPQSLWIPSNVTDRTRHVQDAELRLPIFFLNMDGRLGLPLDAAVIGRCDTLSNAQFPAPLGPQVTTHIRIGVSDIFGAVVDYFFLADSVATFSGVVIASSSDKFKSVTKGLSTIPSLFPSLRST